MLHVAWITLDVAEWMILQFFYTSMMLHVAWITLDDAEWMIYNFLHQRDVARHADHSGRRDVVRRADHSARRRMDDFTIFTLNIVLMLQCIRMTDHCSISTILLYDEISMTHKIFFSKAQSYGC